MGMGERNGGGSYVFLSVSCAIAVFNINSHWCACKSFQKKSSSLYLMYREPLAVKFACHTASSITTKSSFFCGSFCCFSTEMCTLN